MTLKRSQFLVLMLAFLFSGMAGLIYESIWTHYLKLFLGHASYSQILVLSAFLLGMAGGAWWAARLSGPGRELLRGYAFVEIVIGLMGLFFHQLFNALTDWSFDTFLPALGDPTAVMLGKWGLALLLVAPQSVLLGMTFPLMVGGVLRHLDQSRGGHAIASFYFINSLGAALGVWLSGFYLIAVAGMPGTITAAAMINLLVGVVVLLMAGRLRGEESEAVSRASVEPRPSGTGTQLLMLCAFGTGLASFIYEISWIRMLSLVLGTTNHAFELMLGTFILGMALGSLAIRRYLDRLENPVHVLAAVQLVMGLAAALTVVFYNESFALMEFLLRGLSKTEAGYVLFNLVSLLICALIMLPATFCAGMTLPLITHVLRERGGGESVIGRVYAINTLGSIVGVVLVSALLIPVLGLKWALLCGVLVDLALGMALLQGVAAGRAFFRPLPACSLIAFVLIAVLAQFDAVAMNSGVYFRNNTVAEDDNKLIYYRDGTTASVGVKYSSRGTYSIVTNGKPDAALRPKDLHPTADELTMTLSGVFPLAVHPDARDVAVVGFGSGMTSHALLGSEKIERVDTIEIESRMVEGARLFEPLVPRVFADPRSHIYIEDAKTFFSTYNRQYDIIVSEPSNPWVSGIAGLFSSEYYESLLRYLKPDGILAQWIHVYEFEDKLLVSILKALGQHFLHYRMYDLGDGDVLILSSQAPVPEAGDSVFESDALAPELARLGIMGPADLNRRVVADRYLLEGLMELVPVLPNSDYYPVVSLGAVKARYRQQVATLPADARRVTRILQGAPRGTAASLSALTGDDYAAVLRLDAVRTECDLEQGLTLLLRDGVYLGKRAETMPLSEGLSAYWREWQESNCYQTAGERPRAFVDFLQAVASRNDDATIKAGTAYLPMLGGEERDYVLLHLAAAQARSGSLEALRENLEQGGVQAQETSLMLLGNLKYRPRISRSQQAPLSVSRPAANSAE